jgi:ATP-dependent DNA ligase
VKLFACDKLGNIATKAGILLNEHNAEDGPAVFAYACRLGAEGIVSKRIDSTYRSGPCRVWNQGPQSRRYRRGAGAKRELEQVIPGRLRFGTLCPALWLVRTLLESSG